MRFEFSNKSRRFVRLKNRLELDLNFNNLREIGKPVPTNDIWIAAVAFQNGLRLFTKDNHFKAIAGLSLV